MRVINMSKKPTCSKSFGSFYPKLIKNLHLLNFYSSHQLFNRDFSTHFNNNFECFTFNFNIFDLMIHLNIGGTCVLCF